MQKMKLGELFAGYGGLGMAVEEAFGAELAWVSEIDEGPSKVLAHRFPHAPNHGDITKVDWSEVEPVDILSGGFPCQDVSLAGKRAGLGEGTRTGLWSVFAEAIEELKPRYVVAENVRGLLSAKADSGMEQCEACVGEIPKGKHVLRALGAVLGDLADLGYDAQWQGIKASDPAVGAPHQRFRVILLATRRDAGNSEGFGVQGERSSRISQPSALAGSPLLDSSGAAAGGGHENPSDSDHLGGHGDPDWTSENRGRVSPGADRGTTGLRSAQDPYGLRGWGRDGLAGEVESAETDCETVEPGSSSDRAGALPRDREVSTDTSSPAFGQLSGGASAKEAGTYTGHGSVDHRGEWAAGDGRETATDSEGWGLIYGDSDDLRETSGEVHSPVHHSGTAGGPAGASEREINWGPYELAIRRWELNLGRPAPTPTLPTGRNGAERLSAPFVEWMMGLPAGWVTDPEIGLTRAQQLKALGNGVVPQQALVALRWMLSLEDLI